jgi:hypothetical protein
MKPKHLGGTSLPKNNSITCSFGEDLKQSEIIICPCSHVEFPNETKIIKMVRITQVTFGCNNH